MYFLDLRNASEDERYQLQGILSKESRNLEFACGNKLKSKTHNGNQIEQNNKSDNYLQANSNQKFTSSQSNSSEQSLVNSSCNLSNISRNSSNSSLKMNGYHHYNNHNNFHHNNNLDSSGDNQHSNSNHNQFNNFHYNHHYNHSNQHHYHHNSHHVHNSRMQPPPVMPSYSTHPFIPGHLNNGTIQPTVADHPYKMPYYAPQYTANSSKPFYPTNGPAHYTNTVLTSISPIATIAAPSITSNNGPPTIVTSNQMHTNCEQQTNGQQSTNVTTATIENVHTAPYSVTYPTNANAANSYMHPPPAQYIPAHPNAHHFTHHQPMFYVPLHLPQFYPPTHPHYPAPHHLAPQPAILTAPHQQLATPPISPQQDNGETCSNLDNSSNCDLTDLTDNDQHEEEEIILNGKEENATELNKENKDHQTITPTNTISNYNFLSPESMEEKQDTVEIKKDEEDQEEIENNDNELNENNKNTSSTNISSFSSVNELNTTNNDDEQSNDGQFDEILKTNQDKQLDDVQQISEDKIIEKIDENEEELKNKNKELNDNDEDLNVNNEEVNNLKVDSINLNNDNEKEDEFKNDEDKNGLIVKDEEEEKEEGDSTASSLNKPVTPRSWADLFKSNQMNFSKPKITIDNTSSTNLFNTDDFEPLGQQQIESIVKFTSKLQQTIKSVSIEEDEAFPRLSKKLKDLNLKHSLPLLVPRGFTNQSNWCYINSILQALLYCPPFYNLMREIGETQGVFREKSATPVFDSFAKFFTNFMPNEQLMRKVKQSNHFGYDDLPKLPPYEPKCIYNVLGNINNECLKGKQEDAEEFLSSVLNILHEEMLLLLNYDPKNGQQQVSKTKDEQQSQQTTKFITGQQSTDNDKSNSQDNGKLVWKEVKTKHKTLTANNCKIVDTPITDIFGGSMLIIRTAGKDVNHKSQPFFSLKLDIQSDKIRTVEDALKSLSSKESIHGYTCPRTNKTIEASSQTLLDQLPAILVLHLKLHNGEDAQKIRKSQKKIDFSIDLEMPKECLTNVDRPKYSRNYKLLAVVHHDGKEIGKGHYFTDIYHIGTSLWLRCDDSKVDAISVQQLMKPQNAKIPYLLFYRRCDTLRVVSNKN